MIFTLWFKKLVDAVNDSGEIEQTHASGSVELDKIFKRFRKRTITKKSYSTVKGDLLSTFKTIKNNSASYTVGLDDVSVALEPGSSLGVIGRNGSGKSTLLKLISGIYHPDSGSVRVSGRIAALIELGAGFHPDFTGRENIFLGGIMYGLSRTEIENRFDRIVRYAELEDFIDDPVRTYSSGMYMRLGFSLAIHTDPDILLIDEVLAVGDAAFIHRCQDTISDFKRQGKTLIFVTHDLTSVVRWCDEAIWLEKGKIRRRGEPRRVVDAYLQHIQEEENKKLLLSNQENSLEGSHALGKKGNTRAEESVRESACDPSSTEEKRWGNGDVEIYSVSMLDSSGEEKWVFNNDELVTIEVRYRINKPVEDLAFGVGLLRVDGLDIHGSNTEIDSEKVPLPAPDDSVEYPLQGVCRYRVKRLGLLEDTYYLDVAAHRIDGFPFDYHHRLHKFSVRSARKNSGVFIPEHEWEFEANYPSEGVVDVSAADKV